MNNKNTEPEAPEDKFWTRRKKIAIAVTAVLIIVGLLCLALFYAFRFVMIMEWAAKLEKDSEAAKEIIKYLAPTDTDRSATLIALFELIIAVWVGLNIYNFLGKDELERLEDKEKELGVSLETKTGYLNSAVNAASKNSYDVSLATLRNFISLNTAHYATGSYLQEKVKVWQDIEDPKITPAILSIMVNIESLFLSASQANRDGRISERILTATSGEIECNSLQGLIDSSEISESDKKFLDGYVHLRMGDFKFYRGYRIKTGAVELNRAIEEYNQAKQIWFSNNMRDENTDSLKTEELYCLAYLYNVIGECSNVQRQDPMRPDDLDISSEECKELARIAKPFFKKTVRLANALRARRETLPTYFATYFRNSGTVKDFLGDDSPIEDYKEALKINVADYLSHQNIASYFLKKLNQTFISTKLTSESISQIKKDVLPHTDLLILKCPTYEVGYNLSCWAYTLLSAAYLQNNDVERFWRHMVIARHLLRLSELFENNKSVEPNRNRLKAILDEGKKAFSSHSTT